LAVVVEDKKSVDKFESFIANEEKLGSNGKVKEIEADKPALAKVDSQQAQEKGEKVKASPFARSTARDAGIDLSRVQGTGPGGRIVKDDVLRQRQTKPVPLGIQDDPRLKFTEVPLSNMRKTIAERLSYSMQTIPHYYLTISDISMATVLRARSQLNADAASRGFKISVNDFVLKAAAMSLKAVPQVNSSWGENNIRQYDTVDVSFAVVTENGLITPIVQDADKMGLLHLSTVTKELAEKAKAGKLKPAEFQGGTFTVSNLGMFGISNFTAIINPPQSAILAVGKVTEDEKMSVTLSCDHRVIDGATGAKWLSSFRGYFEEPFKLLL
jgi:pyruvate dehydrogenase E2 component (dihydrolipoamide acetyltransferase)